MNLYFILKVSSLDILRRYSMNEKCGSKQTKFKHTWMREGLPVLAENCFCSSQFKSAPENIHRGYF